MKKRNLSNPLILSLVCTFAFISPHFAQARSWIDAGLAYINLAAYRAGTGNVEHNLQILMDSPSVYGPKCIANFSDYSGDLKKARKQIKKLNPLVTKFYSDDANESDLEKLSSALDAYNDIVSSIESTQESSPIKFVMSEDCATSTENHVKNAYIIFWKPVQEDLRNIHTLVNNDLKSVQK